MEVFYLQMSTSPSVNVTPTFVVVEMSYIKPLCRSCMAVYILLRSIKPYLFLNVFQSYSNISHIIMNEFNLIITSMSEKLYLFLLNKVANSTDLQQIDIQM